MPADLNWIISNHGDFLKRFELDKEKIEGSYVLWQANYSNYDTTEYFFSELLRQASMYNIKHANNEKEYVGYNIALLTLQLKYSSHFSREQKSYLIRQLHFNNLQHSSLTLPFKFNVQIKSNGCCAYCTKQNNKTFALEIVLKKQFLPHARCDNTVECKCFYSIIPLTEEHI